MKSTNNLSNKLGKLGLVTAIIASSLYSTGCTTNITKPVTRYIGIEEIEMQFLHPFPERIDYRVIKRKRDIPRPIYYNKQEDKEKESGYTQDKTEFSEYLKIDPNKLTEEQQKYLDAFNEIEQEAKQNEKPLFSEQEIKEIKENYSFINPERLTKRDRVYLIQEFDKAMDALSVFSSQ